MIAIVNRTLISDEDLSVQLKTSVFFQPGLKVSVFQKKASVDIGRQNTLKP